MERIDYIEKITTSFRVNPVVALLGPRQVGKTTLAMQFAEDSKEQVTRFDLENELDLARLESPKLALQDLRGLIIIDEIQRRPELFPTLRVLVDQHQDQKFLILGSASRDLIKQSSESLAGRISYIELPPFDLLETKNLPQLWLRGGFPKAYLASSDEISALWRKDYISTFLERDIPNLGFQIPAVTLRRFWMMLTHYHGQIFNASAIAKSIGSSHTTIRNYLDILVGTFMIRELQPWFENIKKRQIKSSKIYFRDSGIYHSLLGIQNLEELQVYPKLGASWEGFMLEEIIRSHQARNEDCYFWGIHNQAELDLLIFKNSHRLGFEVKYTERPKITDSMHLAIETLQLDSLSIVVPGNSKFPLSEKIQVIGANNFCLKNLT